MQGVQSSYKTDRGVKSKYMHTVGILCFYKVMLTLVCIISGGGTGNIRARFEQMGKEEDVRLHFVYLFVCFWFGN